MKKIHQFECERLRINRDGYDPDGRYWGRTSQDVYRVCFYVHSVCRESGFTYHDERTEHVRAWNKTDAREKVLKLYPSAVSAF